MSLGFLDSNSQADPEGLEEEEEESHEKVELWILNERHIEMIKIFKLRDAFMFSLVTNTYKYSKCKQFFLFIKL